MCAAAAARLATTTCAICATCSELGACRVTVARAEKGAAAAEPWADDARRCQLLLLDICEGKLAEVGRGTREALQETARVLGQWSA